MTDYSFFNNKKITVTGGVGFIGSCLVRTLLNETNCEVRIIDKFGVGSNPEALGDDHKHRYKIAPINLADTDKVLRDCAYFQPEIIIHLAAESHVDRSITGPASFVESNVVGTFSILEAARRLWEGIDAEAKQAFRFHHVSTDEVFGSLRDSGYFNEKSSYRPSSPYSATKAASDHLALAWHHTYGLHVTISNCSNNFGPWQADEKLIPTVIRSVMRGEPVKLYGDGSNIRDWLYVQDHVDAILRCVESGQAGETYCVGAHCERSNVQIVLQIFDIMSKLDRSLTQDKMTIIYSNDRPGHDYRYAIDPEKIQSQLNWYAKFKFDDALEDTVKWYMQHYSPS